MPLSDKSSLMSSSQITSFNFSLFLAGSSSSNFSGPSFSAKTPSSSTSSSAKPQAQPWQSARPSSAQSKPWMSGSGQGPAPKAPSASQSAGAQPTKPNYNLNFSSVIGGREERGVRGPGFGKRHLSGREGICYRVIFMFDLTQLLLKYC